MIEFIKQFSPVGLLSEDDNQPLPISSREEMILNEEHLGSNPRLNGHLTNGNSALNQQLREGPIKKEFEEQNPSSSKYTGTRNLNNVNRQVKHFLNV